MFAVLNLLNYITVTRQEKDISQPASQNKTCGDDAAALQPATTAGIYVYV